MDLRERVGSGLKQAMKDKDAARLSTLRLITAAIRDRDIEARSDSGDGGVADDEVLAILAKMVKQRQESARAYEEGGRLDLAEREREEIEIIREFLPRQLDDEQVRAAVQAAVRSTGAESIRDMGRVMAELKGRYSGQMDFGKVGPMVKNSLCTAAGGQC
jgi:uncharacterized protein YqeY